MSVKFLTSS